MEKAQIAKRWERRKEARPAEIVAAALQLFADRGFAATRLEDVATVAGVSKGTVYLYFEGKEQLFEAVVREAIAPNIDRMQALVDAFEGPTPELLRSLFDLVALALETPLTGVMKLLVAESGNFPQLRPPLRGPGPPAGVRADPAHPRAGHRPRRVPPAGS